MKILSGSAVLVATLVTMSGAAVAATAGHMLRSATPATAATDQDVTGSVKKPGESDGDITGSIKKQHRKDPHAAGAIHSKPNSGQ
jgi:hypothetical protein